jgi:hypothetical protein
MFVDHGFIADIRGRFLVDQANGAQLFLSPLAAHLTEAMRLDVIPPAFEQLRRKKRRRKPVPYDLIPGSLARMLPMTGEFVLV